MTVHEIGVNMVLLPKEEFERMKSCANCDHREVCLIVARRKAVRANDYSVCDKWKLTEEDEA